MNASMTVNFYCKIKAVKYFLYHKSQKNVFCSLFNRKISLMFFLLPVGYITFDHFFSQG